MGGLAAVAQMASLLIAGRIAIVASASSADGQAQLRYAARDAQRVTAVLRELGGFDRVRELRDPDVQALRAAFAEAEAQAAADPALELVFYYSGHADQAGLLLGSARFSFDELKARLVESRAAVRVAFLDACYAGSVVRAKGGRPAGGFSIDAVEVPRVRGAAIVAAGTATELAQESSEIEGSYFTHHVLSALRGAGDRDGNGVVTLAETYQYAYARTLAATAPSLFGPQHPSYDYRLAGTGDLVVTRVGGERRALSFPRAGAPGNGGARVYVVGTPAGEIVAEVAARPDARVRLVVPRGRYRVIAREDGRAQAAEITVGDGAGDIAVEAASFRPIAPELAFAKGGAAPRHELAVDVAIAGLGPSTVIGAPEIGLGYLWRGGSFSVGPHLSYGSTDGALSGIPYALQRWTATALVLRRLPLGLYEVQVGAAAGVAAIRERIGGEPARFGTAPTLAAALALDLPLARWLALRLSWSGGVELIPVDGRLVVTPEIRSSLAAVLRR
jgi:hypothetical protein